MHQPTDWHLNDLVDLEVFLSEDAGRDEKSRAAQDREIFLSQVQPRLGPEPAGRRQKIRLWLEARRQRRREAASPSPGAPTGTPGDYFRQAYRSLLTLLAVAGFLLGSGVAVSHLYYYGSRPINAMVFFATTAAVQVAILLALLGGVLFHRSLQDFEGFSLIRWLVSSLLMQIARRKELLLSGDARLRFQSAMGILRAKHATYGSVAVWPLLVATQVFAVLFNAGVLITLFLLVAFSNRAFGWETTNFFTPEGIHRFVQWVALPWSRWVANAYPTLQQIRDSQVALDGHGRFTSDALASWWPFLSYAVLCYGMIPRLLLLVFSRWQQSRVLARLSFDRPDCNQLLRRMEPVILDGQAGPELGIGPAPEAPSRVSHADGARCLVIVARDIDLPQPALDAALRPFAWESARRIDAEIDNADAASGLFQTVSGFDWRGASPKIVVVAGEIQDPIKAVLKFLSGLRSAAGRETEIVLLLRPGGHSPGDRLNIWKRVLNTLGDPYLSVERTGVEANEAAPSQLP